MEIKEHEYCLKCGRKLKKQEARLLGYGSVCYEKIKVHKTSPLFNTNDKAGD